MSSGSTRQPPSGAAVAWKSSSKPSSGVGRTSRLATSRRPAARHRALAAGVAAGGDRVVDLDEVGDELEAGPLGRVEVARAVGDRRVGVVDHERHPRLQADRAGTPPRAAACAAGPSRSARGSRGSGRGRASSCPSPARRTGSRPPSRDRIAWPQLLGEHDLAAVGEDLQQVSVEQQLDLRGSGPGPSAGRRTTAAPGARRTRARRRGRPRRRR